MGPLHAAPSCDMGAAKSGLNGAVKYTDSQMYAVLNACRYDEGATPLLYMGLSSVIARGQGEYLSVNERLEDIFRLTVIAAAAGGEDALTSLVSGFRYGDIVDGVEIVGVNAEVAECLKRIQGLPGNAHGQTVISCLPSRYKRIVGKLPGP